MKICTVKNRSIRRSFVGTWDGQEYIFAPEASLSVPDYIAYHLKRQSILRDNPIDPSVNEYQLAIKEREDDESPLLGEAPPETLDRSDMESFTKVEYRQSHVRPAAPVRKSASSPVLTGEQMR
mgnify:FL=1